MLKAPLGPIAADPIAGIRQDSADIKTSGGYNSGIGEVLEILPDSATLNPLTYKPIITRITSFCGHNERMKSKRLRCGWVGVGPKSPVATAK